jgi:GT2 family glycosyltransferase
MTQPRASIVIPVFNQLHHTKKCLETLLADQHRPDYEIIVVNNGSSDGTREYLDDLSGRLAGSGRDVLRAIHNAENRGVAPAWNQGASASTGNPIAILNNDIVLTDGWLQGCVEALDRHGLAMVSPFAGTEELNYDLAQKGRRFTATNGSRLWRTYDFCCVVLRRSTWEQIGAFDEKFLVGGYEDTDYAYRLRAAKLEYGVTGASYIHHFGSQTLGEFKKRGDKHAAHNRDYFISKWGEDPSRFAGTWRGKVLRAWRRWKLRFGRM